MRIENTIFFLILHQIYVRNTNFFKQNCTIRILIGQFGTHLRQPKADVNPVQNHKSELHILIFLQKILIIRRKFDQKSKF